MDENIEGLLCKNKHQNSQVILVQLDAKADDRLLCSQCLNDCSEQINVMPLSQVIQRVNKNKNQYHQKNIAIKSEIQRVEELLKQIEKFEFEQKQIIQNLTNNLKEWISQLNQQFQNINFNLLDEIKKFQLQQQIKPNDTLQQIISNYESKHESQVNQLKLNLEKIFVRTTNLRKIQPKIADKNQEFLEKSKIINQFQVNLSDIHCVEENFNNTILFIGYQYQICSLSYQDLKPEITILKYQKSYTKQTVKMIVASKCQNLLISFATSENKFLLECYFKNGKRVWDSFQLEVRKSIQLFRLNQDDSELVICYQQGPIVVYCLNQVKKGFYELIQLSTNNIQSTYINNSYSQILYSDTEDTVTLLEKNKCSQWVLKIQAKNTSQTKAKKLMILNDYQQYLMQDEQSIVLFSLQNNILTIENQLQVSLIEQNNTIAPSFFPDSFSENQQIFIQKHNDHFHQQNQIKKWSFRQVSIFFIVMIQI